MIRSTALPIRVLLIGLSMGLSVTGCGAESSDETPDMPDSISADAAPLTDAVVEDIALVEPEVLQPEDGAPGPSDDGEIIDTNSGADADPAEEIIESADTADGDPDVVSEDTSTDSNDGIDMEEVADSDDALDGQGDVDGAEDIEVDEDLEQDAELIEEDVELGPQRCDPALSMAPETSWTLPYGLVQLTPAGGSGAYQFELVDSSSGALLNALTGAYLAGGTWGAEETIRLTDSGCVGEANAVIHTVAPLVVSPGAPQVSPGTSLEFSVEGGSPSVAFEMLLAPSGGSVTVDGLYTAGVELGEDLMVVRDLETEQSVQVVIAVEEDATLHARPPRVFIPLGSTYRPEVQGGSGAYSFSLDEATIVSFDAAQQQLLAETPGQATLMVMDDFLDLSTAIDVTVVAPMFADLPRTGDNTNHAQALSAGDLNGDGFGDVIFGWSEADLGHYNSGAVFIYAGIEGGFETEPIQTLTYGGVRAFFGRGVALDDLNADGQSDLVVGAQAADVGATDNGALLIYYGLEGGFFPPYPDLILPGPFGYDNFGLNVVTCDFNGDGHLDIAGGAINAEDRDLDPLVSSQGAIHVYLGDSETFDQEPHQSLFGVVPDGEGGWVASRNLRLGETLAVGDMDGDGLCDLASGHYNYESGPGRSDDGSVHVFRGQPPGVDTPGGLSPRPMLLMASDGDDNTGNFGRRLAMGDVTGDEKDELFVSHYNQDDPSKSGTNHGALRVYLGDVFPEVPPLVHASAEDADMTYWGTNSGDRFGWSSHVADVDGQAPLDLVITAMYGEVAGGTSGAGTFQVHPGRVLGGSDSQMNEGAPDDADAGSTGVDDAASEDMSAEDAGPTEDVGLAEPDADEDVGPNGSPAEGDVPAESGSDQADDHVVYSPDELLPAAEPVAQFGGEMSSDIFGQRVAVIDDVDGDGARDFFVIAGRHDEYGYEVGLPCIQFADTTKPWLRLSLPGESSGNQFGRSVAVIEDVTGDGLPELGVGMPEMDIPEEGLYAGQAVVYRSTPTGHEESPSIILKGHNRHSRYDRYGVAIEGAGDFDGDGFNDLLVAARQDDSPNSYASLFLDPEGCAGGGNNTGFVSVYRGRADGTFDTEPAFLFQGPQATEGIRSLKGNLDINGDGLRDFIAGDRDWSRPGQTSTGGFSVVFGRPHAASLDDNETTLTDVICETDLTYVGLIASDNLAGEDAITSLGDLNDDGCDDFAVGAYGEDFANATQGSVRVFFGWGAEGCPSEPTMVTLIPYLNGAQSGYGLAGGEDLNGDGINDLVIGGPRLTVAGDTTGAAWLVSGAYLLTLTPEAVVDGEVPDVLHPMIPSDQGLEGVWRVDGQDDDEWFGVSVALVRGLLPDGQIAVAVGAQYSGVAGIARTGGVKFYSVYPGNAGINPNPVAVFAGETWADEGFIGRNLDSGITGDNHMLMIGGYEGQGVGLDNGSAYVLRFSD